MCCQTERQCHGHREKHHHHRSACECHEHPRFKRRFLTQAEQIAQLEQYLESLRLEIQAVEEQIAARQAA